MLNLSGSDSINQILGLDENSFEVPLYQRRYVWDITNWERIWADIIDQVNIDPSDRGVGHFTGPIVTRSIDGNRSRYEVIDGQQRLTTLQIIFCVIRDLCSGIRELKNISVVRGSEKHVEKRSGDHKLTLTEYDQSSFKKIVNSDFGEKIHQAFDINNNELIREKIDEVISEVFVGISISESILDAYIFFYQRIRIHIQENQENADNLLGVITSDFKLIHLSLDETEGAEAEKVFESINATGRLLSNFDYLRNNMFLRARELGPDESGILYRDKYYDDDEKFWPFEKDWKANELETFLKVFLLAAWDPKCLDERKTKPFEEFRKYSKSLDSSEFTDQRAKIEYEFNNLCQWANSYKKLQDKDDFTTYNNFCRDLSLDDLDAFLLYVIHHDDEYFSQLTRTVTILESYIIRSLLVLENAACSQVDIRKNCYKKIRNFFYNAVTIRQNFCVEEFANFLIIGNPAIDNSQVLLAFMEAGNKNAEFIAYLLNRIYEWGENPNKLSWSVHSDLTTEINTLISDPNTLRHEFNSLWPELSTMC